MSVVGRVRCVEGGMEMSLGDMVCVWGRFRSGSESTSERAFTLLSALLMHSSLG